MESNRNLILAMVLSIGVLMLWQFMVVNPRIEQERKAAEIEASRAAPKPSGTPATGSDGTADTAGAPSGAVPGSTAPAAVVSENRETVLASDQRIEIKTDKLTGSLRLNGARIDDLHLNDYRVEYDKSSDTITLLSPGKMQDAYFAEFGWSPNEALGALPGPNTDWKVKSGDVLTPTSPIVLTWSNDKGLTFERTISVDDTYMFTVEDKVINANASPLAMKPYGRIARFGKPKVEGIWVLHEGLIGSVGEEGLDEVDYSDVEEERQITKPTAQQGWMGITDKYWATALVPGQPFETHYSYFSQGRPFYQVDFLGEAVNIPGSGEFTVTNRLFAGAKRVAVVDKYETELSIPKFQNLIDWGWFYFITKPLFYVLDWIFKLTGNFGVAILLVTVLLKIFFFPLANKSYVSMANMKKFQPEMTAIRERFPDDRQKQQQEMMALYKREKINPAAGCWPVLIQIPVFFALYKVLYVTIEMRHAPFFGWIQDLAAPDPTSIFNLFGLLPYSVPDLLLVGVWPLLMGITMFLQMRMNPTPPDPTQQMIFTWMPVLFTFMLASFPAGLVIYWAWNNFLSIIQQGTIMKRQGAKIELWDNLKELFSRKKKAGES
ncbi:MAG: membrane protein insertase YidC [Pseudomonadota bacterium]